ncbi:hypothetical protein F3J17_29365 [Burkholderia sp. Ax-1719]|nr:hypothetical protein [Burkholderia sp. Ax-1719]
MMSGNATKSQRLGSTRHAEALAVRFRLNLNSISGLLGHWRARGHLRTVRGGSFAVSGCTDSCLEAPAFWMMRGPRALPDSPPLPCGLGRRGGRGAVLSSDSRKSVSPARSGTSGRADHASARRVSKDGRAA